MLNAKSVAMQIVNSFSEEWVEEFFGSCEELVGDLSEIIRGFDSVEEMKKSDDGSFLVRQLCGGFYSFRKDILKAYSI